MCGSPTVVCYPEQGYLAFNFNNPSITVKVIIEVCITTKSQFLIFSSYSSVACARVCEIVNVGLGTELEELTCSHPKFTGERFL